MIAAAHGEDGRIVEEAREPLDLERRRGDDELQIGAARQHTLEHAEQQVDVERALVRLIDDDRVVAAQLRIRAEFREQQSIGHQHQPRGIGHLIGESNAKADAHADGLRQFLGDARRQGAGREPARLGVRDQSLEAASELEAILRQLSTLTGAGLAGDDQDLVALAVHRRFPAGARRSAIRRHA